MIRPLFLARLAGTQEQMGAQHGALVADAAARLLAFYRALPERTLAGDLGGAARLAVRGIASAWQERLARARPPELAARARAFVEAVAAAGPGSAGYAAREALRAFAVMDALQNCISLAGRARLGPFATRAAAAAAPACSTLIAWGRATADGELLFARNFDFPGVGVWDTAPAFVVCAPAGGQHYGFFTTRGADTPVVTVVNEAGLVLAPHTRLHRGVTWGGAMIVDLVHDLARRAECLADAIAIARERPASSSWGLAIGSARERAGVVLELAGRAIDVVRPAAGAELLACTNRYRTPALQAGELGGPAWAIHSDRREQRLRALVRAHGGPLAPRDLARFLGDRRDAGAPDRARRLGAILASPANVHAAVVAPSQRRAWVGVDRAPACEGAWAELAWTWSGPAGGWELGATEGSGFHAAPCEAFVAPHDAATAHVRDAVGAWEASHDAAAAGASIERAIELEPDDPSLRLAAAWLALEGGAIDRAIEHVRAGLRLEAEPYRRGQLLLWGARAAGGRDAALARRWRDELARLDGDGVDALRRMARRRRGGRPHTNLLLADAY